MFFKKNRLIESLKGTVDIAELLVKLHLLTLISILVLMDVNTDINNTDINIDITVNTDINIGFSKVTSVNTDINIGFHLNQNSNQY